MFVYTMPPVVQAVVQPAWQPVVAVKGVLQCFSECVLRAVYTERATERCADPRVRGLNVVVVFSELRHARRLHARPRARALVVWTALYCLSLAVECQTFVFVRCRCLLLQLISSSSCYAEAGDSDQPRRPLPSSFIISTTSSSSICRRAVVISQTTHTVSLQSLVTTP